MKDIKLLIQEILLVLFVILFIFGAGYIFGYSKGKKHVNNNVVSVSGSAQNTTTTTIAYVQKKPDSIHDMSLNIKKTDFSININGHNTTFNKTEDESYMFEKNKIQLDQSSKVMFEVQVKPIDLTKHFGIGLGYSDGLELMFTGPVMNMFDTYLHISEKSLGAGVILRF